MKIFFYSLLTIVMSTHFLQGQYEIEGKVLDATDTMPLEQVSVYFPQLENGTITDNDGNFKLQNLPAGRYKLIVSFIGYSTYSEEITVDGQMSPLEILLEPSVIEMQEVVVSTPFHQLQRENVMKVEQRRLGELKSNGAVTLAQGITQVPGVSTVSTGLGIGKPVIRGLSANRVLVYTQGIRLENQQFGDEHGLGINDAGIASIEVIKGPASLLYGSDALGGVLYLNPESFAAAGEVTGELDYSYFSNTNGSKATAAIAASGNQLKFLARATTVSHTDYESGGGYRATNSRFGEDDLKMGVGYSSGKFKTDLRYNYNSAELGIVEEIGEQSTERTPLSPYQDLKTHILSSTTNIFFNNSSLKTVLGYTANYRQEYEEEALPELDMDLKTFNYKLDFQLPRINQLETIVGFQGMHQTNENFGEEILIPDATTKDIGFYATSHLHFKSSDLQLGLRFDNRKIDGDENGTVGEEDFIPALDRSFNSFNAAIGYRADLGEDVIARVNLASGFRAPNLAELTSNGVHEGTNRFEIGDPNLGNEQNFQIDAAIEYSQEHVEFFVNAFLNSVDDFIYVEPTGDVRDGNDVYLYRQQNAELKGAEIGFHLHPHPLDWLHFKSSFETVRGTLNDDSNIPLIPANSWRNTLRVELARKGAQVQEAYGFITFSSFFEQDKVSEFETTTPGYSLLDIGFGGKVQVLGSDLNLRVSANNVLDKEYTAHLSRLKTDGIANIGRNIMIGVTLLL